MPTLSDERIAELLKPFVLEGSVLQSRVGDVAPTFSAYLDLLLRWNARTNLTAVREPEMIVQRHFGESVFSAGALAERLRGGETLLDFGSGAGFPGLPIQICMPQLRVTLAESQGKKSSFLREAVRSLGLSAEVWAGRAELMPLERRFDVVSLRAVDRMDEAVEAAAERVCAGGSMLLLTSGDPRAPEGWRVDERISIPNSAQRFVTFCRR